MIEFTWNGRRLQAQEGDSAAVALLRNGIWTLGASRKRHGPLGFSGSFVQGVLAEVNGTPNVRLDRIAVREGMAIRRQNAWPSPRFDLLKAFRLLPSRWVRGGFEHPKLLPSGTRRFERWEHLLSFLAGEGSLSPDARAQIPPGRKLRADAVVVGGGPHGVAEANRLGRAGKSVVLIARRAPSIDPGGLKGGEVLRGYEAFGAYRGGTLIAAAPLDAAAGAVVIETEELILATGRRSCPPLVPGNDLPGVMDLGAFEQLLDRVVQLGRVVLVGTDPETALDGRSVPEIVQRAPVAALSRIHGRRRVTGVDLEGRHVPCDLLVHAGPWLPNDALLFQATAEGTLRLTARPSPPHVRLVGSAAEAPEAVHVPDLQQLRWAAICPCMDVPGAEILDLVAAGMTHVEELKRQTGCGMGPCQGAPCWDLLRALVGAATRADRSAIEDRPTQRPPARGLTVAQAAGLDGLVEPQQ